MKSLLLGALLITASVFLGCGTEPKTPPTSQVTSPVGDVDPEIVAAMAEFSPEDRAIAEAQGYCAAMTESKLGSMGPPHKLMINGQPVFLCCDGCEKEALKNPEETLAKVAQLKAKSQGAQN